MKPRNPRRILVIRDGRIGDMLMMTPVLRWLAREYPAAQIDLLTGPYGKKIIEGNPALGDIIVYDRRAPFVRKLGLMGRLRGRYDLAVVLEVSTQYALLAFLIGAKYRIGMAGKMKRLLHHSTRPREGVHSIRNNLGVLNALSPGAETFSPDMDLYLAEADIERARRSLASHGVGERDRLVYVQAAAGPTDVLRPWPAENIAAFADLVIEKHGAKVLVNAGPGERPIAERIARVAAREIIIDESDVRTTAAIIKRASVVVTGDTGMLHVAGALGTPLVALFGSASSLHYGPIGSRGEAVVLNKGFPCSPCKRRHSPEKEKCLGQGMADCMRAITPEEVLDEVTTLWDR